MIPRKQEVIRGTLGVDNKGKSIIVGKSILTNNDTYAFINKGYDRNIKEVVPASIDDIVQRITESKRKSLEMQINNLFQQQKTQEALTLQNSLEENLSTFAKNITQGKEDITVALDGDVKAYFNQKAGKHIVHAKLATINLGEGKVKETMRLIGETKAKHKVPLTLKVRKAIGDYLIPLSIKDSLSGNLQSSNVVVSSELSNMATIQDAKNFLEIEDNFFNFKMKDNPRLSFNKKDAQGEPVFDNTTLHKATNIYASNSDALSVFGGTYNLVKAIIDKHDNANKYMSVNYSDGSSKQLGKSTIEEFEKDNFALSQALNIFLTRADNKFETIAKWLGNVDSAGLQECAKVDTFNALAKQINTSTSREEYTKNINALFDKVQSTSGKYISDSPIKMGVRMKTNTTNMKDMEIYNAILKEQNGSPLNDGEKNLLSYFDDNKKRNLYTRVTSNIEKDNIFINSFVGKMGKDIKDRIEHIFKSSLNGAYDKSSFGEDVKNEINKKVSFSRNEQQKITITDYKIDNANKTILDTPIGNVSGFYAINKIKEKTVESDFIHSLYSINKNNTLENVSYRSPEGLLQSCGFAYFKANTQDVKAINVVITDDMKGSLPDFKNISSSENSYIEEVVPEPIISTPDEVKAIPQITDSDIKDSLVIEIDESAFDMLDGFDSPSVEKPEEKKKVLLCPS